MLQQARDKLSSWDWRLFAFILLFLGLPNIYQLYRVRLIGNELPDTGSLAIVSQWQFVGLVVEVFQEATVLAIFFFLGSQIRSAAAVQLDRAKSVLAFIFIASLVFSVGVFSSAMPSSLSSAPRTRSRIRPAPSSASASSAYPSPCWRLPSSSSSKP